MCIQSLVQSGLLVAVLVLSSLLAWATPAEASLQLNEQFKATQACEAFQSIRRQTNPGNIRLTPNTVYPVVAKNKPDATHYHLKITGADPELRWVAIDCGELLGTTPPERSTSAQSQINLLAISWQPAFCETHTDKTECQTQTADRFDATNFTLHGLWPQPRSKEYCNVRPENKKLDKAGKWGELPEIDLSPALLDELNIKMPGVASDLHLHEWYKHGTCYSATPEEYYRESLALLDQVNGSDVRKLFVDNIDREITSGEIRNEFSDAFSSGAGAKVSVECARDNEPTQRRMIQELQLNLKGEIKQNTSVADLLKTGKSVNADCPRGEVDRVGLN